MWFTKRGEFRWKNLETTFTYILSASLYSRNYKENLDRLKQLVLPTLKKKVRLREDMTQFLSNCEEEFTDPILI